jgi:hypothetical protein
VENSTFQCGSSPSGSYGRHPWVIRNGGTKPLRLRIRFTSGRSGFSLGQGEEHVIEAGSRITVHLTWLTPVRASSPFASYAILWTNDPKRAEVRLRVVGTSGPVVIPVSSEAKTR